MIYSSLLALFMALFVITAPIAAMPMFVTATQDQSASNRHKTSLIAALTYVCAAFVALFAGNTALAFFGVDVAALRLAGMAVVAVVGWQMINAPTAIAAPSGAASSERLHAASNTRLSEVEKSGQPPPSPLSIGVTPLGFPIYAGPGVLSVVIAWGSAPHPVYMIAIAAIFANAIVFLGLNALATPITRIIGAEALMVTEKLFGLIVVSIAVGGMASALLILFPGLQGTAP